MKIIVSLSTANNKNIFGNIDKKYEIEEVRDSIIEDKNKFLFTGSYKTTGSFSFEILNTKNIYLITETSPCPSFIISEKLISSFLNDKIGNTVFLNIVLDLSFEYLLLELPDGGILLILKEDFPKELLNKEYFK